MTTLVTISAPHYKADGSLRQADGTWTIAFDVDGLDTYRTSRGLLPGAAGLVQDKDSVLLALAREVHRLRGPWPIVPVVRFGPRRPSPYAAGRTFSTD